MILALTIIGAVAFLVGMATASVPLITVAGCLLAAPYVVAVTVTVAATDDGSEVNRLRAAYVAGEISVYEFEEKVERALSPTPRLLALQDGLAPTYPNPGGAIEAPKMDRLMQ